MSPSPTQQPQAVQSKRRRLRGWGAGLLLLGVLGVVLWARCGKTLAAGIEAVGSIQADLERTSAQVQSALAAEVELAGLTFTLSTYGKSKLGLVVSWFPRSDLPPQEVEAINRRVCAKLGNGDLAPRIDAVVAVAIRHSEVSAGPMRAGGWSSLAECSGGAPLSAGELKELVKEADPTW